jgi:small ligand-binding sensory domain FIST
MPAFASALSRHPLPTESVGEVAGELIELLGDERPDLVVCFASPHFAGAMEDMAGALRRVLEPQTLVGMTVGAVIGGGTEVEDEPAFSAFAARLERATIVPVRLAAVETPDGGAIGGWPEGVDDHHTLLLLADPFTFPADALLERMAEDRPDLTIIGGLASAAGRPGGNRLVLDGAVHADGAVGVFFDDEVVVRTVVSQGCRPVGRPLTVTAADGQFVKELGGVPAMDRLRELVAEASEDERQLLAQGLHVGIVVDEHRVDFGRGDFLVRNVLGADRETGAIAVGDRVSVGQTLQFHVRDAAAADEDLRELLAGHAADAALLFTCNGRGRRLFGEPDHDAGTIETLLGPLPLAGAFCAGEIGPVGPRSFLHGFTASVALFGD